MGLAVGVVAWLAFPWLPFVSFSTLGSANLAAYYALVAVSLVVLVGWVGQISLGHAGFVGIGAYVTGHVANGWHVTFPVNLLWAAVAGAAVAAGLGVVAVRVRGLYLAVATLIFGWMAAEYLFRQKWFTRNGAVDVHAFGEPGQFPYFDWTSRRTHYYAAWAVVGAAIVIVANLRDTRTGRAFAAVRGSEVAAASLGVRVARTKVTAFAVSGALAAMAGNLLLIRDQVVTADAFKVETSLFFLAVAVVGGLSSLGGAVASAALFAALNEAFFRFEVFSGWLEVVPPLLLTACLLAYRGGLGALGRSMAPRLRRWIWGRPDLLADPVWALNGSDDESVTAETAAAEAVAAYSWTERPVTPVALDPDRSVRPVVLAAEDITVRFGGLTAVDDVTVTVREHEIVGLIGPNGAGKTTFFNAVAGLNQPAAGRVSMLGTDVTGWSVEERATLGVGRTFQAIQLLPALTVFENLLVATHLANPSGFWSNAIVGKATVAAERAGRAKVDEVADLLGIHDVLDRRVADLPFGVLRMVELARVLVTGATVAMLDEPASGLDSAETAELGRLLRFLRGMGMTLLLIEHDVALVTSIADYMYVLDRGALLAEGTPAEIRANAEVVAAYLGGEPVTA